MLEHSIQDINAKHDNVVEQLKLAYKALKTAIQRRCDELLADSEKIRSSKGIWNEAAKNGGIYLFMI